VFLGIVYGLIDTLPMVLSDPNICFLISFLRFDRVFVFFVFVSLLQLILKFDLACECETEEWYRVITTHDKSLRFKSPNYDLPFAMYVVQEHLPFAP
jgi:hypothetical protein